jgi:hypothetical protein
MDFQVLTSSSLNRRGLQADNTGTGADAIPYDKPTCFVWDGDDKRHTVSELWQGCHNFCGRRR